MREIFLGFGWEFSGLSLSFGGSLFGSFGGFLCSGGFEMDYLVVYGEGGLLWEEGERYFVWWKNVKKKVDLGIGGFGWVVWVNDGFGNWGRVNWGERGVGWWLDEGCEKFGFGVVVCGVGCWCWVGFGGLLWWFLMNERWYCVIGNKMGFVDGEKWEVLEYFEFWVLVIFNFLVNMLVN